MGSFRLEDARFAQGALGLAGLLSVGMLLLVVDVSGRLLMVAAAAGRVRLAHRASVAGLLVDGLLPLLHRAVPSRFLRGVRGVRQLRREALAAGDALE